jgi:hypothetical protein
VADQHTTVIENENQTVTLRVRPRMVPLSWPFSPREIHGDGLKRRIEPICEHLPVVECPKERPELLDDRVSISLSVGQELDSGCGVR